MYKVQRLYFNRPGKRITIMSNLSLKQAQEHCSDPETSSSTCKSSTGRARTRRYGPWFDSYTEQ